MRTKIQADLYKAADALLDAEYLVQEKRRQRDDLIRKAVPGMTLQAIGDMVGLTRAAVGLIVKCGRVEDPPPRGSNAPTS